MVKKSFFNQCVTFALGGEKNPNDELDAIEKQKILKNQQKLINFLDNLDFISENPYRIFSETIEYIDDLLYKKIYMYHDKIFTSKKFGIERSTVFTDIENAIENFKCQSSLFHIEDNIELLSEIYFSKTSLHKIFGNNIGCILSDPKFFKQEDIMLIKVDRNIPASLNTDQIYAIVKFDENKEYFISLEYFMDIEAFIKKIENLQDQIKDATIKHLGDFYACLDKTSKKEIDIIIDKLTQIMR